MSGALCRHGLALPVMVIIGHDDIQIGLRAMRVGVVAYVQKPVHAQDLLRAIERALGRVASERSSGRSLP